TLALMVRAGHVTGWRWWRVFRAGPEESLEDLEKARANAEQAVHETLGQLAPAMTIEIASASVSVAGDMAGGVVDTGSDILEASDQIVEAMTEDLPGGSVVNQMWDVVLAPGRFGVKAATTVFRRGDVPPTDRGGPDDRADGVADRGGGVAARGGSAAARGDGPADRGDGPADRDGSVADRGAAQS
ncbi:MAG TPA: hypothetical protein VFH80_02665, partial [Solirubrobacteraceae bacterium]|nr:hypothetical protein [Solirubrobacteraceae bacterium]